MAEAILQISGGAARLELVPDDDYTDTGHFAGIGYHLVLRPSDYSSPGGELAYFIVPQTGYPIGRYNTKPDPKSSPKPTPQAMHREDLAKWFDAMISQPASSLIGILAFIVRNGRPVTATPS